MKLDKHSWMIVLCCAIPIALLVVIYFLGVSNIYVFWLVVLLCPLMHFFMMKYMHDDKRSGKGEKCH